LKNSFYQGHILPENLTLASIKKIVFDSTLTRMPHLKSFSGGPYTFLKARYYMYWSIFLLYMLIPTGIQANTVTILYGFAGILGAVLLSMDNQVCTLLAIFVFFNKGILDWTDGHLARIKSQTSKTGHVLDEYGAILNSIGLAVGLGFFVMHATGMTWLLYIIPLMPFFHGAKYTSFAKAVVLDNQREGQTSKSTIADLPKKSEEKKTAFSALLPSFITNLSSLMDDRARSVDFILLIIAIDTYFGTYYSLINFALIFLRLFAQFSLSFIFGVRNRFAEKIS
jgi:phosphatidylglycerophosphate synthase